MKKLIYLLVVTGFTTFACSNQNNQSVSDNIQSGTLQKDTIKISEQPEAKFPDYDLDTITFEHFEKLVNSNIELAEPIPTDWIKKLCKLDSTLFYENNLFKGLCVFIDGEIPHLHKGKWNYKLVLLVYENTKETKDIFVIFDNKHNPMSSLVILKTFYTNKRGVVNSDIIFHDEEKEFKIEVSYFDTKDANNNVKTHPDLLTPINKEVWYINENLKFQLKN